LSIRKKKLEALKDQNSKRWQMNMIFTLSIINNNLEIKLLQITISFLTTYEVKYYKILIELIKSIQVYIDSYKKSQGKNFDDSV